MSKPSYTPETWRKMKEHWDKQAKLYVLREVKQTCAYCPEHGWHVDGMMFCRRKNQNTKPFIRCNWRTKQLEDDGELI